MAEVGDMFETAQEVLSRMPEGFGIRELTRELEARGYPAVSEFTVYRWFRGHAKWPAQAIPLAYEILKASGVTAEEWMRLCAMKPPTKKRGPKGTKGWKR